MAEVIVSVVAEEILEKLFFLASQEIRLAWGFKVQLQKLRDSLSSIQAVLKDAEGRQVKDNSVRLWLRRLKDVTYDAEDVLDEVATELLSRKMKIPTRMTKKVHNFFSPSNPVAFRYKMALNIKDINEKLDGITKDKDRFQFREGPVNTTTLEIGEGRKTHAFVVGDSPLVGRDSDYKTVLNMVERCCSNRISVLSIVGMGGIGKTALARLVYNNTSHFDLKMWICASDDFDVERLIREIIESVTKTKCDLSNLDEMASVLQDRLSNKSVLLVLDDVWNEDAEKWNTLKSSLLGSYTGGRRVIIVTTRNETVATIMGTAPMYHLAGLSDYHCWSIFKQQAFGSGVEETPNFVQIGKEIVKKCGGSPLAAKTLGGLMRLKREETEWAFVRDSEIRNLPEDKNNKILSSLKLSYEHLPSQLKQCFAYCSIFPKDYWIEKDMLIKLWMAEGFVPLFQSSGLSPENIANEYFNNLLWRSFFQDVEKDRYGDTIKCKMHTLIHELAQHVDGNESSIVQADKLDSIHESTRHLSFVDNESGKTLQNTLHITKGFSLRTFLVLDRMDSVDLSHKKLLSFKCLRVLDLSRIKLEKLSPLIGKLKHLRYLDLSETNIKNLPNSISNLHNLQTLKLQGCHDIRELPKGITGMINLRYLEIDMDRISIPKDIGKLTNLQTLPIFRVRKDSPCAIGELGLLDHIRGKLDIFSLENMRNGKEASKAKLKEKKNLRCLKLSWECREVKDDVNADDVIEGFQPPPYLKELQIIGFPGVKVPSWMVMTKGDKDGDLAHSHTSSPSLLPSLKFLTIMNCNNLESLSNMRDIPSLKELIIKDCGKLTSLSENNLPSILNVRDVSSELMVKDGGELASLPKEELANLTSLHTLWIENCPNLTSLPAGIQGLKSLQQLRIHYCLNLASLPAGIPGLKSLRELRIHHCPNLTSLPNLTALVDWYHKSLESLKVLEIVGCSNLTSLPNLISNGFSGLLSLRELRIHHCLNMTFLAARIDCLSLKVLEIVDCPNLKSLTTDIQCSIWVEKLRVHHCLNLTSLPAWSISEVLEIVNCPNLTLPAEMYLKVLEIANCPNLTLSAKMQLDVLEIVDCLNLTHLLAEAPGFSWLHELRIYHCPNLTSLPDSIQGLACLRRLRIHHCPNLTSLPAGIQGLKYLDMLEIVDCSNMTSLPAEIRELKYLQVLEVVDCPNLTSLPAEFHELRCLRELRIHHCPNLTSLPAEIKGFEWLREVRIHHCPNLTTLPTGILGLKSLEVLEIVNCPNMTFLPAEIQSLISIQELRIQHCPI